MKDIVITIAPFLQGYCLGSVLTLILCVSVVGGLMRLANKQKKDAIGRVLSAEMKK